MKPVNIALFASGKGTNADRIMHYFKGHKEISIQLVVSNKKEAGVLSFAENHKVPHIVFSNDEISNGNPVISFLKAKKIDYIVLSGFLRKIPEVLIASYPNRIINIHPSLLPKHGGKGMYGDFVHKAVLEAKDKKTGITIHTIDEEYDHGTKIAQYEVEVDSKDTMTSIRTKVQELEHRYFASTIEQFLQKKK